MAKEFLVLKDRSVASDLRVPNLIVAPRWLAQHLQHPALRLLDARSPESYEEGHIPGARQVDLAALTHAVNGVDGMLLSPKRFADRMSRLGVGQDSAVVIYDDNWGLPAARILWSLVRYGHANVAVLNGGSDHWQEDRHPWTSVSIVPSPSQFVVRPDDDHSAERSWLLRQMDRPDLVLLDTRSPGEYAQGHLPGALPWDWINGLPVGGWDTMRPRAELLAELISLGVTPDKEVVTYCQSGVRAAHTYLLLRDLGYPRVRVYDGSWLEWSKYQIHQ